MAKKKDLHATDFDSFDDGTDFNFDDFNFDGADPKDDRHPVLKAMSPLGKGVKSYVTDRNNIERFVKASLPRGYGQVHELGTETASELKALYNSAKEELKPVSDVAKAFIGKALPKVGDKLPKGLRERLEKMSKQEAGWQSSRGETNEEKLAGLMGEVFNQQQQQRIADQKSYVEKENVRQSFEQVRHSDSMSQLALIRQNTEAQVQYQNTVGYNYQKKSLELKYRTFWALAELVKEQKQSNAAVLSELKSTVKNTGLPDFVKTRASESFAELSRNKFLESARESMFGGAKTYLRRFTKNLSGQVTRTLAGVGQMAGGVGAAGSMLDGADIPESLRNELIAQGILQIPLDYASEWGGKKLNAVVGKNRHMRRSDYRLRNFADSAGDRLHEALTDPNKDWGIFESLREVLRNAAPNAAPDARMETDSLARGHEPLPFSRTNSKSINEIIPGMLARIHQELKIIRTGDENVDLVSYDFAKNRFTTERALGSRLRSNIAGKHSNRMQESVNKMLDSVDLGGKLTPAQRELARKTIIDKAVKGGSMDISKIAGGYDWGGGKDGAAIAGVFNRYLRAENGKLGPSGKSAERQMRLTSEFRALTNGLGDPRAEAQMMVNAGQLEMLQRAGLIDDANQLDRNTLAAILNGEDPNLTTPTTTGGGTGPRRLRKGGGGGGLDAVRSSGPSHTPGGGGLAARSTEKLTEELQALRASLSEKGGLTTGIDDSQVAKDIKSIEALLQDILEQGAIAADRQINIIGGIASHMGAETDEGPQGKFSTLREFVMDRGRKAGRFMSTMGRRHWRNTIVPGAKGVLGAMDRGAAYAGNRLTDMKNRMSGYYGDVFVAGENLPRLRVSVLKAGGYFDAKTGRMLTSFKDVTGDIKDAAGNIVMTGEEFANGFIGGSLRKSVKQVLGTALGRLTDLKDLIKNVVPDGVLRARNALMSAAIKVRDLLPPYDVYLKGDMSKPLLYANAMRYNTYFSQKTSKPITHPRQIDGPVVDKDGKVILSVEHLEKGIVDVKGDPAGPRGLARFITKGARLVGGALNKLRQTGANALGVLGNLMGSFGDYFKGIFTPFTEVISNSRKSLEVLEKIHALLDERLAGKVKGDVDGDGVRDGSITDILKKREDAKGKKKDEQEETGPKSQGMLSKLIAGIGSVFSKKKKDEDEDEEDDDDGFGLDDAADLADIADAAGDANDRRKQGRNRRQRRRLAKKRLKRMRAPKTTGAPGRMGRMGRMGAAVRSGAASAAQWGVFNTAPARAVGALGARAIGATAAGASMAGGAAMTAGRFALPLLARGAGFLLSWPVSLALTGAWLGYQAYKYSQKTKPTDLSKLRLVQYGVKPDDKASSEKLWELEQLLEECLVGSGENMGLDMKKLNKEKVAEVMGLTQGDAQLFNGYFNNRFSKVFVHWMRQIKKIDPDGKIAKIESVIPAKDKWTIALASIQALREPMSYMNGWSSSLIRLPCGTQDASNFLDTIRVSLQKQGEKDGGEKAVANQQETAATLNSTATAQAIAVLKKQELYNVTDKDGKKVDVNQMSATELTDKIRTGAVSVTVALNIPKVLQHNNTLNQVDALTAVRMKAYGLNEMKLAKVQQLGALERYMADHLDSSTDSPVATVKTEEVLHNCAEIFGVAGMDSQHGNKWKFWFNGRFLPVFLLYVGTVRRITKRKDLDNGLRDLPIGDQLVLARALVSVKGPAPTGGRVSVWTIPSNPWNDGEALNDNPDSTAGNIEAIRVLADKVALGEVSSRVAANRETDETKAAFGWYKGRGTRGSRAGSPDEKVAGKGMQASGDKLVGNAAGPGGVGERPNSAVNISGAGQGLVFGAVQNGAYSKMPEMKGVGWSAARDLVLAAAKATGVDARAIAMVMAQESGFDPNASPKGYAMKSGAAGLGQHVPGSWNEDMRDYGQMLGIPAGTSPFDPKASALLTAMRMRRNGEQLEKALGRKPTASEIYLSHVAGGGGATSMLKMGANGIISESESGSNAKKQHPEYFYDRQSGNPMTVAQSLAYINKKLEKKLTEFGVSENDFTGSRMVTSDNPAVASAAAAGPTPEQNQMNNASQGYSAVTPPSQPARTPEGATGANLRVPVVYDESKKADIKNPGTMVAAGNGTLTLTLVREDSEDDGTYGTLRLPDGTTFMTIELPWRDNKNGVSCIPPGSYKCRRRPTTNFGNAYEVMQVPGRSGILIHQGNSAGSKDKGQTTNSSGCILLGLGRGRSGSQKVITSSLPAMKMFYEKMGDQEFTLNVQASKNASAGVSPDTSSGVNLSSLREKSSPAVAPVPSAPAAAPTSSPSSPGGSYGSVAAGTGTPPPEGGNAPLPRMSRPKQDLSTRTEPTVREMQERDKALTQVISPALTGMQATLTDSLVELRRITTAVETMAGKQSSKAAADAKELSNRSEQSSPAAAVPQRRNI